MQDNSTVDEIRDRVDNFRNIRGDDIVLVVLAFRSRNTSLLLHTSSQKLDVEVSTSQGLDRGDKLLELRVLSTPIWRIGLISIRYTHLHSEVLGEMCLSQFLG